ncbi:unnamed protein product [Ilex paraguariensis]|uniref:Subtilisin-like protease SBT1.1 n=1 Tax=Ilex paraguariensis TaxID=185542 RepID=A0ABC8QPL8_9AQUA
MSFLLLTFMASTSFASPERQTYVVHMDKTKIMTLDNSLVYETAISGFAAKLSLKQLESLKKVEGFLSAIPDEMLSLHTTHSPQFLGLKNGKGLWNAVNMASDVIIGIVDSGIWPEHTSFQDSTISPAPSRWKGTCEVGTKFTISNCNKKLIGARAFYKGYEASAGRIDETVDYRSPRDSKGHGTHTASTAAGNLVTGASFQGLAKGSAGGMKYTARIAAYKVCYALGCSSSDILAAIDQAVSDGVDVLSLSLGGAPKPYYNDSMAIASFSAVQNGVFVSCSAGNFGPSSSTVTNGAPWIMTVAASYLDRSFPTLVKLGDSRIFKGASLYSGKPTKQLPLVSGETAGGEGAKYCTDGSLSSKHVKGKIVVCERGINSRVEEGEQVKMAGGAGMILVNQEDQGGEGAEYCTDGSLSSKHVKGKIVVCERGINSRVEEGEQVKMAGGAGMILVNQEDQGEELFADPHILPATSLGASAGVTIKNYISSVKKPTASIVFEGTVYGDRAPIMAAFSSRGPSVIGPDVIKPDVTAPGVNILAAWPPNVNRTLLKSDNISVLFKIISGTSMSCPHVSGLAALLRSVHKDWSPAAIKSALMTSAYTLDNKKTPIADAVSGSSKFATPFAFGSGHVDPKRASDPGLIHDTTTEDYLNFLCSLNYLLSNYPFI